MLATGAGYGIAADVLYNKKSSSSSLATATSSAISAIEGARWSAPAPAAAHGAGRMAGPRRVDLDRMEGEAGAAALSAGAEKAALELDVGVGEEADHVDSSTSSTASSSVLRIS